MFSKRETPTPRQRPGILPPAKIVPSGHSSAYPLLKLASAELASMTRSWLPKNDRAFVDHVVYGLESKGA